MAPRLSNRQVIKAMATARQVQIDLAVDRLAATLPPHTAGGIGQIKFYSHAQNPGTMLQLHDALNALLALDDYATADKNTRELALPRFGRDVPVLEDALHRAFTKAGLRLLAVSLRTYTGHGDVEHTLNLEWIRNL